MPIHFWLLPENVTLFTHRGYDGKFTTFCIDMFEAYIKATRMKPVELKIDPEFATFIREKRGIEQYRLDRLRGAALKIPVIYVKWQDGTHLMIDGHHRYVKKVDRKDRYILGYLFNDPDVWNMFTVSGVPHHISEIIINSPSRIP